VDVFCSAAFFGGAYCPMLGLKNESIAALMRHLWSLRKMPLDVTALKQHESYQAVMQSGILAAQSEWALERGVRRMHLTAHAYANDPSGYRIVSGDILYKIEGRDEYGAWSYGFETNADYLYEHERGRLTEAQLVSGLALHVRCGEFSFARLPATFQHILGVTGTLDEKKLPPQMHAVLREEVGIKSFTYCPSMYHTQKRDFVSTSHAYVQLAKDDDEHLHLITDEIDLRLKPTRQMDAERAVIVFFNDEEVLQRFRTSSYFRKYYDKAQVLTALTAARREDRDNIIKAATRQGMVTLATPEYARGTDFKIFDDRMEACGGIHVLQTFFSLDLSEEVQMMGRAARQGNKGSYSLVLAVKQLAMQFDELEATIQGWAAEQVYASLDRLRQQMALKEVASLRELARQRKTEHDLLIRAIKAFHAGSATQMDAMLRRYNAGAGLASGANGLHVVLCLDESYSMQGPLWAELVDAFHRFWAQRLAERSSVAEHVSVVQFSHKARVTLQMQPVGPRPPALKFGGGTTSFLAPVELVSQLCQSHGPAHGYTTVVVFMSDGGAQDAPAAASALSTLAQQHPDYFACYTVGFGSGASRTLASMAFAGGVQTADNYRTADVGSLSEAFAAVASSIAPGRL